MSVSASYQQAGPVVNTTPVTEAISSLHFEGNLIPHTWYQHPLLRHENGKAYLVAITLLADICYWYRQTVLRDEQSGRVVSVSKKFSADKLLWRHEQRAEHFGLTKRQSQDAIGYLKKIGAITVEVREEWEISPGVVLVNQVFVEPVPAVIGELCGHTPLEEGGITLQRDTPHVTTGHPSRLNGGGITLQREHSKNTTEISSKISKRLTLAENIDRSRETPGEAEHESGLSLEPGPIPGPVRLAVEMTGDAKSLRRFWQLYHVVIEHHCQADWDAAADSTRRQLERKKLKPDKAGAYFCAALLALLEKREIFVPTGPPAVRAAESAEARAAIASSLFSTQEEETHV